MERRPFASGPTLQQLSNVVKRIIFGCMLISGFLVLIKMGPIMIMFTMVAIQVMCFKEIISIGYNHNKIPLHLPNFRFFLWYFLIIANYFLSIECIGPHLKNVYQRMHYLRILIDYNRFISFCLYLGGMMLFVVSLAQKHNLKQFRSLAWTHTLLIIIVLQSYMVIENLFLGQIWLILPVSLVILNDIFAYVCGRVWGKTPLIKLSPKKTWEGFIGGCIGTFMSGFLLTSIMSSYEYFICPVEIVFSNKTLFSITTNIECTPSYLFQTEDYDILGLLTFKWYPFLKHFIAITLFASIIAPFGGFCASGFKRAVNVKDFGNVIPGHGGIMDRFDCQYLMATFVNVYIFTFIRNPSMNLIFEKILYLNEREQLQFYHLLRKSLQDNSLIAS